MSEHYLSIAFGMQADAYPLEEKLVLRSGIVVFESQLSAIPTSSPDYGSLSSIIFETCFAGASDFPIYPFVCAPKRPFTDLPTAAEVLSELRITNFQSEHIASLNSTQIPYPGYHPGTKNDEIHTDAAKQYLFAPEVADDQEDAYAGGSADLSRASHAALRSYVLNRHLFYILVHDKPKLYDGFMLSDLVLLFAVGIAPKTGHLVGAVSCQVCHNLCD